MARVDLDLGDGHTLRYFRWAPDRELNPQYAGIPDAPKAGAIVGHQRPDDGSYCEGAVTFDVPAMRAQGREKLWSVESFEPLTLSPSLLCTECGDHGFIRAGRWVRA